jgi:hypothetical protein
MPTTTELLPTLNADVLEARRLFLQKVHGGQPVSSSDLGEHFQVLCASGFLVPVAKEKNAIVPPRYRAFSRDVVFLAPEPRAEAEIGRFAERRGQHMGTLFRITKRSIIAGAAAGITAEQTFETLRECCSGELPPNVQQEISGWFAQCRRASLRPAVLIHCPDAETAARVQAVAGTAVTPMTETILKLHDASAQAALLRKLREAGTFVSSREAWPLRQVGGTDARSP